MSVIGAITYELPAATSTANALGVSLSQQVTDPGTYSAIAWVMTLGILPSIVLPPILMKKIQGGMVRIKSRDSRWGDLFMSSMFLGMISAFLGMVFLRRERRTARVHSALCTPGFRSAHGRLRAFLIKNAR